ncbi:MAG: hypothetical protein HC890_19425 [Chloroflexaceae bacterium]|nr:hypothetical protein [Chloroflexaceae bacterium]
MNSQAFPHECFWSPQEVCAQKSLDAEPCWWRQWLSSVSESILSSSI